MNSGIAAVAAIFAFIQTPTAGPVGPMNIDDAVSVASRNAFGILIQRSVAEKSHFRSNEQKASVIPTVYLNGTYTRNQKETSSVGQNGTVQVYNPLATFAVSSQLSIPIDLSRNIGRGIKALQLNEKAGYATLDSTISDVRLSARTEFYAVLRAEQQLTVLKQAVTDAEGQRDQARLQFDKKQIAKIELMRYETQVDQSKSDLITGKNNLQNAKNQFNYALSRPIETPVDLVVNTELPKVESGPEPLVLLGQTKRPEIQSLTFTLQSLTIIRQARETSLFPSLNVNLNYQRNIDGVSFGQSVENINAQFLVKIPIFDGGVAKAQIAQAREDEKQAKLQIEQLKLGIASDIRTALSNIENAKARLENASEQVKLAEEVFRLAKVKQDAGEGTYVEVIDAQTQLVQARNGQISARFDYLSYYAQLQRAVGTDQIQTAAKEPHETNTSKGMGSK